MRPAIDPEHLRVYVIVDPRKFEARPKELADAVYGAGAGVIQLRAKGATDDELRAWGFEIASSAMRHERLFVMNDRVDIAVEVGADGVHLGPDDGSIASARSETDLYIGGSAGTVEVARALVEQGADYLGCGAIWEAAPSKPDASSPRGLDMIRAVSQAVDVPIVGIGGVTLERAPSVIDAGAAGVAVIRAIQDADDPAHATRLLVRATSL